MTTRKDVAPARAEGVTNPIALLVNNICNLNNGAMEAVGLFVKRQPLAVRARFIERCSSLIGYVAEHDASADKEALATGGTT